MVVSLKKSIVKRGFLLFIGLSVTVMVGILIWTNNRETWIRLADFRWSLIPLMLILSAVRWIFDGTAFISLTKDHRQIQLNVKRAATIRLEGNLVAAVLPIVVGTFSMHAYLLHKARMSISESLAVAVLRSILPVFIFLLNIPILIAMRSDPISDKFFAQFIKIISLPLIAIIVFFIITLFYPHQIKKAASGIVRWWGRVKFIHIERILAIEERIFEEIDQFSRILWSYIRERKQALFRAIGWILVAFFIDYLIAAVILWGFGFHPPLVKVLAIQCLIRPIIFMAPTPGGAGIWEFTYLGFFSLFMPHALIGVSVLIWRILLTYLPVMAGTLLIFREFRNDSRLRQALLERGVIDLQTTGSASGSRS